VQECQSRALGEEHPDTLETIHDLAELYRKQGRFLEADERFIRVGEARSRVVGEERPDTLSTIADLAWNYVSQRRLREAEVREAEELSTKSWEGRATVLGEEHPDTLDAASCLSFAKGVISTRLRLGLQDITRQGIEARCVPLQADIPNTKVSQKPKMGEEEV
jgi:hypothetical protein